jgi:hypothetical protein
MAGDDEDGLGSERDLMDAGVPFWLIWLLNIWPLPFAGLVNWLARDNRQHRADLSDVPADYLRTEYRASRPPAWPRPADRWPG